MATKQDFSYGVIPIRQQGDEWEVFLIHQYSRIGDNSYWVFPKGHPEEQETPLETATRELFEETGFIPDTVLTEPQFTLSYSFWFDQDKIEKTVIFYIGIIPAKASPTLQVGEVKEAGWYSLRAAAKRLDYSDTKKMFGEVCEFLEKRR